MLIATFVIILIVSVTSAWIIYSSKLTKEKPASNLTAISGVSNGLQLSITLEANKTKYAKGEEVPLILAVTNVSNQTLNFTDVNGNTNFDFEVYNSKNTLIYQWQFGAYPLNNFTATLAPNENYNRTLVWSQDSILPSISNQVPSGSYHIIGDIGQNIHNSAPWRLQTAPLNITIT
jgi:hypothetical protein